MKKTILLATMTAVFVGLSLLTAQSAEARNWKHYLRDHYASQGVYANPGYYSRIQSSVYSPYVVPPGYGYGYPSNQNYGYGYAGRGGCR